MKILSSYLKHKTGIYIKIDTGYHRTGLEPGQTDEIEKILNVCKTSKNLHFRGFLSHFGQTYATGSKKEIFGIYQVGINRIKQLKEYFNAEFPSAIISIGDTPSCSLMEDLSGADEIRPGNFVFYDVMQYKLGSCDTDDIAVAVACPVVAKHASRNEIAIYGGAVHLSKEFLAKGNGSRIYGLVVNLFDRGWSQPLEGCYVSSLSQEHGIMKCPEKIFHKTEIGSLLGVLPVHSCLTANLASHYLTLDNKVLKTIHSNC